MVNYERRVLRLDSKGRTRGALILNGEFFQR